MAGSVQVSQKPAVRRQRPVTTYDATESDDDVTEPTDLSLVKEVSQRLKLATRRPSTVQWKQVIEFRKSIGLYNSDVEPEYLDKMVEERMKSSAQNSPKQQQSPLLNGKSSPSKSQKNDDVINNNVKHKNGKKLRPKSESSTQRKTGISILKFSHHKKNKSKKSKEEEAKAPEIRSTEPDNLAPEPPVTPPDAKPNGDVIVQGDENDTKVPRFPLYDTDDESDDDTTGMSEMAIRYRNITRALGKVRRDLIIMRMEDNKLARKLLDARSELNLVKVRQSCDEHAEMLDDVTYELEEEDMLPGLIKACDLPSRPPGSLLTAFSSLRNIGVSRMNINRRRFSIR